MNRFSTVVFVALLALTSAGCGAKGQAARHSGRVPAGSSASAISPSDIRLENRILRLPKSNLLFLPEIAVFSANPYFRKQWVLAEAGEAYQQGRELFEAGDWAQAREEFDHAIDILLTSRLDLRNDRRVRYTFDRLVDRIYEMDLAVARVTAGEDSPSDEAAAIDDVVPLTFPPDAEFRGEVEKELAGLNSDLPLVLNDEVLNLLNYFHQTDRGRRIVRNGLRRRGRYEKMIHKIFAEEGIPLDLISSAQAESSFKPNAVSRARAVGMWQFMMFRAKEYGLKINWWVDERRDPIRSTRAAARHLRDLYEMFGDWYLVLAAYNSGPGTVLRGVERTGYADFWELLKRGNLPRETSNHVPLVIAFTMISKDPDRYGIDVSPEPPLEVEAIPVKRPTSLKEIAKAVHVDYDLLREMNPHVLRGVTPPGYPGFRLYIPVGMSKTVLAALPKIPEAKRVEWGRHRVRRGETLSGIAWRYGTSAYSIAQANGLSLRSIIRPGQSLFIPGSRKIGSSSKRASRRTSRTSSASKSSKRPVRPVRSVKGRRVYTVQPGDTLFDIAMAHGITSNEIARANGMSVRKTIHPGLKLIMPAPTQAAASAPPKPARKGNYTIRRGDTLSSIGERHGVTATEIAEANGLSLRATLRVGDKLMIPRRTTQRAAARPPSGAAGSQRIHRVRSGDTLWDLGRRYGVSVSDLRRSNAFLAGRPLRVGDQLAIPASSASAAARDDE